MTPRERLLAVLSHREPDRIPVDLGTNVSSIHRDAYARLRRHLGLAVSDAVLIDRMQQVVAVEEDLLERLRVDTRQLFLQPALPWVSAGAGLFRDEWGILWRSSAGGLYFDIHENPLGTAGRSDLERYRVPDPDDPRRLAGLREAARHLAEHTDYAVVLNGFGECVFGQPALLRGHEQFFVDLLTDRDFAETLIDRVTDYNHRLIERALGEVGRYVQVVRIADDLGSEQGLLVSPQLYRELIKPRQRRLCSLIKDRSDARILLHTCGAVRELIPDFIEIGIDAINPVQVSARGMDSRELKQEFGSRISFWGGGCDTQAVLPFGTAAEVAEEVRRRIRDLAPGGGFVFTPVHNIQADVPPENVLAMYDTLRELGSYPVRAEGE